jgi:sec-independent protein translocase protein TatA
MMTGLTSPLHIALLLLIALLLFGAKRLPEIGRGLGGGMREFKESITGHTDLPQATLPASSAVSTSAAAPAASPDPLRTDA